MTRSANSIVDNNKAGGEAQDRTRFIAQPMESPRPAAERSDRVNDPGEGKGSSSFRIAAPAASPESITTGRANNTRLPRLSWNERVMDSGLGPLGRPGMTNRQPARALSATGSRAGARIQRACAGG